MIQWGLDPCGSEFVSANSIGADARQTLGSSVSGQASRLAVIEFRFIVSPGLFDVAMKGGETSQRNSQRQS